MCHRFKLKHNIDHLQVFHINSPHFLPGICRALCQVAPGKTTLYIAFNLLVQLEPRIAIPSSTCSDMLKGSDWICYPVPQIAHSPMHVCYIPMFEVMWCDAQKYIRQNYYWILLYKRRFLLPNVLIEAISVIQKYILWLHAKNN